MSKEDKDLAEAALDLYGEPTIEDSEDKRLPNGQSAPFILKASQQRLRAARQCRKMELISD